MATFNDEVTLIGDTNTNYDDYGNPVKTRSERTVLCNQLSVYGNEFYNAATVGLKPQYILSVHDFEYENERKVIYKEKEYDVLRTYQKDNLIELTVGEKIGH